MIRSHSRNAILGSSMLVAFFLAGFFSPVAARADMTSAPEAWADIPGPYAFEPGFFDLGSIDGQAGWSAVGQGDSEIVGVDEFPAAAGYEFGAQSLRVSNGADTASGVVSPSVQVAAGERLDSQSGLIYSFDIGTTINEAQPGLAVSVSAVSSGLAPLTQIRFEDAGDGIDVIAVQASNPGPAGAPTSFSDAPVTTLSYGAVHHISVLTRFLPGPGQQPSGNDVVKVSVDGVPVYTGHSWENYYRYDTNQGSSYNAVPQVDRLYFQSGDPGGACPGSSGQRIPGRARVSQLWTSGSGQQLGAWVGRQRRSGARL